MRKGYIKRIIGIMMVFGLVALFAQSAAAQGHAGGIGLKKIYPNLASDQVLAKATGCNLEIAREIVKYREANGPFKTPEDLLKVSGMTKEIYENMNPEVGPEGDLFLLLREGEELDDDDDNEPPLAPSKC